MCLPGVKFHISQKSKTVVTVAKLVTVVPKAKLWLQIVSSYVC